MKKFRNLFALILALLMVVSLSACGDIDTNVNNNNDNIINTTPTEDDAATVPNITPDDGEQDSTTPTQTDPTTAPTSPTTPTTQPTPTAPTEPTTTQPGQNENNNPQPEVTHPTENEEEEPTTPSQPDIIGTFDYNSVPAFSGKAFYTVNGGEPYFTNSERQSTEAFEKYSSLDRLGRCGVAYANICKSLMPTESRGDISSVYPSGWKLNGKSNNNEYSTSLVDGGRIYNRAHLIGFQLAGENANNRNLITGTRYMNVTGMLPFENMIADYVKETNNHVLYRVTPIYVGNELVCRGVLMEAYSVEDDGDGVCYNVFCYNVQPGITINYSNGENWLTDGGNTETKPNENESSTQKYILNTNSKKFHYPDCSSVNSMSEKNKKEYSGTRDELIKEGYDPCKACNP